MCESILICSTVSCNNNNNIIINKFICNSTELDSHRVYNTHKHNKYKALQMRRYVTRNLIHTKSISFVSNTILTLYIVVLTDKEGGN